ncbi:MAG TPA: hypothetical protein VJZ00_09540 [Thermoanaerobaculia bacterium]|nr:hypothetical protein [Thermoanaerobaculia bacterium]
MPKSEDQERETKPKKKKSHSGASTLRNVITAGAATETLVDLIERLGLVDIVIGRLKSRLEETDLDDLFDEVADYMRRNPEVLVVTLGGITVATGMLVWLNSRREWDGAERRGTGQRYTASPGRVRKAS